MRISCAEHAGLYQIVAQILAPFQGASNGIVIQGLRKALPLATFFRAFGAGLSVRSRGCAKGLAPGDLLAPLQGADVFAD